MKHFTNRNDIPFDYNGAPFVVFTERNNISHLVMNGDIVLENVQMPDIEKSAIELLKQNAPINISELSKNGNLELLKIAKPFLGEVLASGLSKKKISSKEQVALVEAGVSYGNIVKELESHKACIEAIEQISFEFDLEENPQSLKQSAEIAGLVVGVELDKQSEPDRG